MLRLIAVSAIVAISAPAAAQSVKSQIVATNGVKVDVATDEFAGRVEYVAPTIDFKTERGGTGAVFVARIKKSGTVGPLLIQGFVMYSGDWRYYTKAVFRGGDPVDFTRTGGKVGSCRYGCSLSEDFAVKLSPEEVKKHAVDGQLDIQIRSNGGETAIFTIPASYMDAVNEVAR